MDHFQIHATAEHAIERTAQNNRAYRWIAICLPKARMNLVDHGVIDDIHGCPVHQNESHWAATLAYYEFRVGHGPCLERELGTPSSLRVPALAMGAGEARPRLRSGGKEVGVSEVVVVDLVDPDHRHAGKMRRVASLASRVRELRTSRPAIFWPVSPHQSLPGGYKVVDSGQTFV
jgi:hypothetical protein